MQLKMKEKKQARHLQTARIVLFECTSDWMKKWRQFLSQSCCVVMQNHCNYFSKLTENPQ